VSIVPERATPGNVGESGVLSAAELRALGLALCRPDPGEKKPTYARWGTRSLEPGDFGPGAMYGIITGPLSDYNRPGHALVIPDIDDLDALAAADDFLPPTGMQEGKPDKPRDHRGFLVPFATIPEWGLSKAKQAAPAALEAKGHPGPWKKAFRRPDRSIVVDFLGCGGQAVCPSPGSPRRWDGGFLGSPAVVPFPELWDAVCRLAMRFGAKAPRVTTTVAVPADPPAAPPPGHHKGNGNAKDFTLRSPGDKAPSPLMRRVLAYLDTIDPAVSGQGGHDGTYWPARVVCWGFDLGRERGFEVLAEHFNPRCQPPWSDDDLRHKCEDADTLPFDKPRGWLLEEGPHFTDRGNARRVAERHGKDLRYCHPWKAWLAWDGKRWAEDQTGEAVRRVKDTQTAMYADAMRRVEKLANRAGDDEEANRLRAAAKKEMAHALRWEDARAIARSLELARSEPDIPVLPPEMDRDRFAFNCLNGTIDLRSGELRRHRREDLLTKLAPVNYDPDAACPLWERCLLTWMDGNADLITYLQRVAGHWLTGDVGEQSLWFFHGAGANGKSTYLGTLLAAWGDYGMQSIADLLMVKHHESHPTERADLFGKRLVCTIETEEGKRMAEALMKQLTGGDKVRARKMRQDFFEFDPAHKIALAANHKPQVRGTDYATWRRIKLIPFTVTIEPEAKDRQLPEKLKAELPGILAWAVRGCLDWQRHGIAEPDEVRQATAEYQREQDIVCTFIGECCLLHPEARVKVSVLYEAYGKWSGDRFMTQPAFNERLRAKGYDSRRTPNGYFWHGLTLDQGGPEIRANEPV
jgi:putative DNA primase/helicase